ncbi:hypothetical protein ACQW02_11960 [Humitalea sp. 24SJ18S-53]|uniref:hypothetical protein n=1 Tax=Humitalea sp. 24SJ18S-53 TaxID=3422307 RepID=UPI003D673510
MTSSQDPMRQTGGTTPSDLEAVRRILRGGGWRIEWIPNERGDGPWIAVTAPGDVAWAIGRQAGSYFAARVGEEEGVGLGDLATAEEAAEGLRRFVRAEVSRFLALAD